MFLVIFLFLINFYHFRSRREGEAVVSGLRDPLLHPLPYLSPPPLSLSLSRRSRRDHAALDAVTEATEPSSTAPPLCTSDTVHVAVRPSTEGTFSPTRFASGGRYASGV